MKDQLKEFAIQHAEKVVLGICGAVMLLFVWMAVSVKPYDKNPQHFDSSEPTDDDFKNRPDMSDLARKVNGPIDPAPYTTPTQWRAPYNLGMLFRQQPDILTAGKPEVQENSGALLAVLTRTGTDGKVEKIVRKVPKSKASAKLVVPPGGGGGLIGGGRGRGGRGGRGGNDQSGQSGAGPGGGMAGGEGGMRGGGMIGGAGGPGGGIMGEGGMSGGMEGLSGGGGGMFGGNEGMDGDFQGGGGMEGLSGGGGGGLGGGGVDGGGIGGGAGGGPRMRDTGGQRRGAAVLGAELGRKDAKKKDEKKDDVEVEEYVIGLTGRPWVEIVAPFPHQDQIKEYVKKLREPAAKAGLRYFMPQIERRELSRDGSWSNWGPIDIDRQFEVVENAIGKETEKYPQPLIPGLAMNIPRLDFWLREFLHNTKPEFMVDGTDPNKNKAEYTPEEINPFLKKKKEARKIDRLIPPTIPRKTPPKDEKKQETPLNQGGFGGVGKGGNATGKDMNLGRLNKDAKSQRVFDNHHQVKTAMVRYWDFTVQPGRRYQYRVKVAAFNPNYNRNDVARAEYASIEFLTGDWSEPSDEIYVSDHHRWFASKQPSSQDPNRAQIEVHAWARDMGEWLVTDLSHSVGELIGVSGTTRGAVKAIDIIEFDHETFTRRMKKVPLGQRFDGGTLLLDVEGGRTEVSLGTRKEYFKLPREIVAVNRYGDIIRRSDAADGSNQERQAIAESYQKTVREGANPAPTTPGGMPGGGRGGRGEEDGGRDPTRGSGS
jgi:hypothetical protein